MRQNRPYFVQQLALGGKRAGTFGAQPTAGSKPHNRQMADLVTANRDDPKYSIIIATATNADARTIGAAARAKLREAGELGPDRIVLQAADKNTKAKERYQLPLAVGDLAVGDKVRLFDRVFDASAKGPKQALASNGDVVEIRDLSERGMVICTEDGREGLVLWRKLQERKGGPIRLCSPGRARLECCCKSATVQMREWRSGLVLAVGAPNEDCQVRGQQSYGVLRPILGGIGIRLAPWWPRQAGIREGTSRVAAPGHTPSGRPVAVSRCR